MTADTDRLRQAALRLLAAVQAVGIDRDTPTDAYNELAAAYGEAIIVLQLLATSPEDRAAIQAVERF